ncbi:MAG TPA: hypothetical protein VES68_02960 [Candidatus Sulfotelmatobacter sp.]|nr:hypothetical protein [Candidatus Sulfotelmatobacter sp.]
MTEAPSIAPETVLTPIPPLRPNHSEIPAHLIKASDGLGMERGKFMEIRVQNLIASQKEIVESVIRHEPGTVDDELGHDLTATLTGDSPLRIVYIQVKSSRSGIIDYKKDIRDKYFSKEPDGRPELVKKWLTDHGIILLNGSETKTNEEILESFYPQLQRIQRLVVKKQNLESTGQVKLFPDESLIQIWPEALDY